MDSDTLGFLLFLAVVWWIIAAIAVSFAARTRGRSGLSWFGLAVLVGPILAAILLLAYPCDLNIERTDRNTALSIIANS